MADFQHSVLIVDDEPYVRETLQTLLSDYGYATESAEDGVAALNILQQKTFDLLLLDVMMPRVDGMEVLRFVKEHFIDSQVIMLTAVNDIAIAVESMQLGAYSYLTKPYSTKELVTIIGRALERKRLLRENKALKKVLARYEGGDAIVGRSPKMMDVLSMAARVAPTDSVVLIQGPSGTGKELIAHFLHKNSARKEAPFTALNCASLPETLLESELFGHEKGAFTDAVAAKQGLVEITSGGTLFLDEIGEISPAIQPKLLRFLETGEFRRLGGNKNLHADVRIISATNKDLRAEVGEGRFREDLLYRLNIITLQIPPLRDRTEDIPLLVEYFIKKHAVGVKDLRMEDSALSLLMKYEWPGNIRELENVVERASILSKDAVIRPEDLALPIGPGRATTESAQSVTPAPGDLITLKELERNHIARVLKSVEWNKNIAAKILGISLKTLYTKIASYRLKES